MYSLFYKSDKFQNKSKLITTNYHFFSQHNIIYQICLIMDMHARVHGATCSKSWFHLLLLGIEITDNTLEPSGVL